MRGALLILACASCDGVFGINPVPLPQDAAPSGDGAPARDGMTDSPQGELTIMLPSLPAVWVGDTLTLTATINGPIHATVTTTASATIGSVSAVPSTVMLNANGLGAFPVTYTAPSSAGSENVIFNARDGSLSASQGLPFTVAPLTSVGLDGTQAQSQTINADDAIGARLTISSPVTVRKVGVYTSSAGSHVRLGIYAVNGTATPGQLQTAAAPLLLVSGRNETDVNPTSLAAGDYWIVADFDADTQVQYLISNTGLYGTSKYPYANNFPLVWGATWVDVSGSTFALFMRVEQ